jgi:uncharacterized protein (TIGR02646 family)
MRYIPLHKCTPDVAWLAKADNLLSKLKAAKSAAARSRIINKNAALWGDLKQWLLQMSHQKCWFSEATDCFSHFDVEHFRPKKSSRDADGTKRDGYWWLAFDWKNFRICGNAGNRKKGTYFPLRAGCARCLPHGDIRYEDPQLLDPTNNHDPSVISFNMEGEAMAAAHVSDSWEKERAAFSIKQYHLNFPPLAAKRKVIWNECWRRIQDYLVELNRYYADKTNTIAKNQFLQAADRIYEMLREEAELSATARACLLSTPDVRIRALLQSA